MSDTMHAALGTHRPRIIVADDHVLLLEALSLLLTPVGDVVGTATCGASLLALCDQWHSDLVITDLSMPGVSGFDALRSIRQQPSPPPVLVLTVHTDIGTLRTAIGAGAAGYVVKNAASSDLVEAARTVLAGGQYLPPALRDAFAAAPQGGLEQLSQRQRAVLDELVAGHSAKQIATRLGITERTVIFHKDQLRKRLGAHSPLEMADLLRRAGAVSVVGAADDD